MREYRIRSFAELHEALAHFREPAVKGKTWLFRGQARADWPLQPKAARVRWQRGADLQVLEVWKRRAVQYAPAAPQSDWDWAALAQHHGLATRLLDWSVNPLAAAFFALCAPVDSDAAVYAFHPREEANVDPALRRLNEFDGIGVFRPRSVAYRIASQVGVFTVHAPPEREIVEPEHGQLARLIIDSAARDRLLHDLDYYGMNQLTLFPDLDGLSWYLNWYYEHEGDPA